MDYYIDGLKMRDEERLYALWVGMKTSLGGNEVPEYSKLSEDIFISHKELMRKRKQERESKERRESKGLGTLKGQDLINM